LGLVHVMPLSAVTGLVVGFFGVVLLVSNTINWSFEMQNLAVLAAFSAPILYGIAANYTSEKLSHISPLAIATFSQLSSAIVLLPLAILFFPSQTISLSAWLSVIALATLCTSLAYLLYFHLIAEIGATKAITVTFMIPVFGMFWGWLFLNEKVTLSMLLGSGTILLGTALVTGLVRPRGR